MSKKPVKWYHCYRDDEDALIACTEFATEEEAKRAKRDILNMLPRAQVIICSREDLKPEQIRLERD